MNLIRPSFCTMDGWLWVDDFSSNYFFLSSLLLLLEMLNCDFYMEFFFVFFRK